MSKVKNGRIQVPHAEANGVARVITSGQVVATRIETALKLERYLSTPGRFDEDTMAMYGRQLEDVKTEMVEAGTTYEDELADLRAREEAWREEYREQLAAEQV